MKKHHLHLVRSDKHATFQGERIWPNKWMEHRKLIVKPRMTPKKKLKPVFWIGRNMIVHDESGYHAHSLTIRRLKDND